MYEVLILSAIADLGSAIAAASPIIRDSVAIFAGLAVFIVPILRGARRELDLEEEARRRLAARRRR